MVAAHFCDGSGNFATVWLDTATGLFMVHNNSKKMEDTVDDLNFHYGKRDWENLKYHVQTLNPRQWCRK